MASSNQTQQFYNTDFTKWSFSSVKRNENGQGSSIRIKASESNMNPPVFIFGRCRCPFGIQDPFAREDGTAVAAGKKNLTLNVEDPQQQQWLGALDEHFIGWVTENSAAIFNRAIKRSTIEDVIYYRALRPAKNEYAPTTRLKVNLTGPAPTKVLVNIPGTTNFYIGNELDLVAHCEVIPTVKAFTMWVTNNSIGISFSATHLLVFPPEREPSNPYIGYTEVPRPVPGRSDVKAQAASAYSNATNAAPAAPTASAAAPLSAPGFDDADENERFTNLGEEDPTSMF